MNSLDEIQAALIGYTSLQSEQLEPDEQHPVRQLLIRLGDAGSDCVLRLFCANNPGTGAAGPLSANGPAEVLQAGNEVSSVFYFVVRYPDELVPALAQELQRLLGVINQLLPLGTLELHSEEGLFFRHMLLNEEPLIDSLLALDIVLSIDALLPPIFDWIREILAHATPGELQEQMRGRFRQLLQQTPMLETLELPPPASPPARRGPIASKTLYAAGLGLSLLSTLATALLAGPLWGIAIGLCVLAAASAGCLLYQQRQSRWLEKREQLRQLRFYWQLLEVEAIKLSHQDQALDQQQSQIELRLSELAAKPADYPSDILRLRQQMLSLRQLQSGLEQRDQQLKSRRRELEQSRYQLLRDRLSLMPEADSLDAGPEPSKLTPDFSAEDMLMQNLVVTLEYLDFQARTFSRGGTPILEVIPRSGAPAISIRWLQRWHLAPRAPEHTWMLCFDLTLPVTIPTEAWPRVQELLQVFHRFLPLGTLICDYTRNHLTLRYRFVRLRGDLSTLLVMEILEVMGCFGEKLHQRLLECLDSQKQLATILSETESDFQALQI